MLSAIGVGDGKNEYFAQTDEELTGLILQNLKKTLAITGQPQKILFFRTENAIPQYYLGHSELVKKAGEMMREHKGIYIGGNTLCGISVADCMKLSGDIAENILKTVSS